MATVALSKHLSEREQTGHFIKTFICGAAIYSPNTNSLLKIVGGFHFRSGECLDVLNILMNIIFQKICYY